MAQALQSRMSKEVRQLAVEPPPGVWCAPRGDSLTQLDAQLEGPADTVYEGGVFRLSVDIPARYPFEPPKFKFVTPVYHPNIDPEGRICLDILNMPPKGAWRPSLNLSTVLQSLGLLLGHPNPDDGLVTDITSEYKHQRQAFDAKARQWTRRHAMPDAAPGAAGASAAPEPAAEADAAPGGGAGPVAAGGQQRKGQQEQEQQAGMEAGNEGGRAAREGIAGGNERPGPSSNPQQASGGEAPPRKEQPQGKQGQGSQEQWRQQGAAKRSRLALRK